jgi:hypothetical protein
VAEVGETAHRVLERCDRFHGGACDGEVIEDPSEGQGGRRAGGEPCEDLSFSADDDPCVGFGRSDESLDAFRVVLEAGLGSGSEAADVSGGFEAAAQLHEGLLEDPVFVLDAFAREDDDAQLAFCGFLVGEAGVLDEAGFAGAGVLKRAW